MQQLLPLSAESMAVDKDADGQSHGWDYIYEPDAADGDRRAAGALHRGAGVPGVAENMASEHSARMVAMKAATDNAGNLIGELKLIYNKHAPGGDHQRTVRDRRRRGGGLTQHSRIESKGINMADVQTRQDRSVHRRGGGRGVPAQRDAQGVRRAEDGRRRADARSPAAARRRRGAHHCAGLVRRPAPRPDGVQHRQADLGAGRPRDAGPHHGRARPPDRRARPGLARADDVDPPQAAGVRRAEPVAGPARNRHQGDRPGLPVRQGRQGRPVRRRRRRQDREHDGADQQHRQGAQRPVGVRRCRRAHPRGQRLLSRDGRLRRSSTSRTCPSRRSRWSTAR